jgi:CheY-like chemotaxis protein
MFGNGMQMLQAYLVPMLCLAPVAALLWWMDRSHNAEDRVDADKTEAAQAAGRLEKTASPPPEEPLALVEPAGRPRLLVVDDSAVVRVKLRRLFEGRYEVVLAGDGEEALAAMESSAPFAVVLTDLEMPKMDGFALIAAIQGALATENVPIIAITGREDLSARVHDCQGLFGIFRKSWVDRELIKRVDAIAAMSRQA